MTLGERFARALAAKDAAALRALLSPGIEFRAMTPGRFWESDAADEIVDDIILGTWFTPSDDIVDVIDVATGSVGSRQHVSYRLAIRRAGDDYLVEQHAYLDPAGEAIGWLRIMCSGYQPRP